MSNNQAANNQFIESNPIQLKPEDKPETPDDLILAISAADFKICWSNAAAARHFSDVLQLGAAVGLSPESYDHFFSESGLLRTYLSLAMSRGSYEVIATAARNGVQWKLKFDKISDGSNYRVIIVVCRNLSTLQEYEARLARSEGMYQSLFESMAEGAVFQAPDGRIVTVNKAAEFIEGRTAEQMVGVTSDHPQWGAVRADGTPFPAEDHPSMVTLRTGRPQSNVIMGITRPTGEKRWISINSQSVIHGGNEQPAAVVTTFHDVTDRLQLEANLDAKIKALDSALEQTLIAMSEMIEMRDPYTAGHQRQVAQFTQAIAKELGWTEERSRILRYAALVHDIGKIAVPAEILVKPGCLTDLEYQIVQQHAEIGYRVLQKVEFAKPIAEIVRQHHERLDGSGYPQGRHGDEICMEARIIAVADVVDSMISHRPYRTALGLAATIRELDEHIGTLYDPIVVDALKRTLNSSSSAYPLIQNVLDSV